MMGIVIAGSAEDKHLFLSRLPIIGRDQLHLPGGLSSTVSCCRLTATAIFSSRARSWRSWLLAQGYWMLLLTFTELGYFDGFPNMTWVKPEFIWNWRSSQSGLFEFVYLSCNLCTIRVVVFLSVTFSEFAPVYLLQKCQAES